MFTNNFAQPAPNAIPHNRAPERARRNKTSAKTSDVIRLDNTKHDELAAINSAVLFYLLEFRGLSEAPTFGKSEAVRRRAFCHNQEYSKSLSPAGGGERLRNNLMSLSTEKAMC
jgi:hypothetical protein